MSAFASLLECIRADSAALVSLRRDIHAHPELGFQEHRTSELIASALSSWGIPVHRGLGKTGVVGIIKSGTGTRAIGLRADMDALPMTEHNTQSVQSIVTRNKPPMETAVISVTMIHAGEAVNVVPDACEIRGTVRTFSHTSRFILNPIDVSENCRAEPGPGFGKCRLYRIYRALRLNVKRRGKRRLPATCLKVLPRCADDGRGARQPQLTAIFDGKINPTLYS